MDINLNEILFIKFNPISSLKTENKAAWGKMSAQQMTEHLIGSMKISNGNSKSAQVTPDERLDLMRKILLSEKPFKQNTKNPVLPDEPNKCKYSNLFMAKQVLYEEIITFYNFFEKTPHVTPINPVFGMLNKSEWEVFHTKHFEHHFRQFGLIK